MSPETKRSRFVRIAEARTNKIIHTIRLLGNCSNANAYEYSEQDIKKIFTAIENELKKSRERFVGGGQKSEDIFTLG